MNIQVTLVLDDGTVFPGTAFGSPAPRVVELATADPLTAVGEVVFNTAMSGYHEVLTDPSYTGQLVAMTYPHVGNYGCDDAWSEVGPEDEPALRERPVKPAGFIVRSLYTGMVPNGRVKLHDFLAAAGIPGISGIDTRALTLHLRDNGSRNGILVTPESHEGLTEKELAVVADYLQDFPAMEGRDLTPHVGAGEVQVVNPDGSPHIALLDCGLKANILRELLSRGCKVTILPSSSTGDRPSDADALFVSNGPGDPAVLSEQVRFIADAIGTMPVLGICLGHQLIAQALGASTFKMPFGHHGVNHPVRDEQTHKVFVTSQNHGFAVEEQSIPTGCRVWFRNANDGTVEGLHDEARRVRTTQFHPESAPGPDDALWIFDAFLEGVQ